MFNRFIMSPHVLTTYLKQLSLMGPICFTCTPTFQLSQPDGSLMYIEIIIIYTKIK